MIPSLDTKGRLWEMLEVGMGNQGFTLIEMLVIVAVVGILGAIASPSFLAFLARSRVNNGLETVRGTLWEAQREAMKRSQSCTVTIPEGNNTTITATSGCLVTGSRRLENVSVDNQDAAGTLSVTFNFKGSTSGFTDGTMVFSPVDTTSPQRCLVVSTGIGIMRAGSWASGSCTTTQ